jgi:hypothetical protein
VVVVILAMVLVVILLKREMLRRSIQELEDRLNRITLDNRQLRNERDAVNLRLAQTEQLLGDTTAPTVFNQI